MTAVSPFLTFPYISWWAHILNADCVIFDAGEHFEKMTFRNRYRISGANNSILLSVPLVSGRNQHIPMNDVRIYNGEQWQTQHWRTLVSVYRRTPYFDHYEESLKPLFNNRYSGLIDFNRAGIEWVRQQLKLGFEIQETTIFQKKYPETVIDLRGLKPLKTQSSDMNLPKYYQVFQDRIGFQPDLSILDLLFAEGPGTVNYLKNVTEFGI